MIQIFVHAQQSDGERMVAEHYEFAAVPRVGEFVTIDDEGDELLLKVVSITNHAKPKGDFMTPVNLVELECEIVGHAEDR